MGNRSVTRERVTVSLIASAFLILLYCFIFDLSGQSGEDSGDLSRFITGKCISFVESLRGRNWSEASREALVLYFEHPVRKAAHFAEYACMGVLEYVLLRPWMDRGKRLYAVTIGWVAVSAALDEFHQAFIPMRYASPADVCLDTLGGACAVGVCVLFEAGVKAGRKTVKRKKQHRKK